MKRQRNPGSCNGSAGQGLRLAPSPLQFLRVRSTMRWIRFGLLVLAALGIVLAADAGRAQDTFPSRLVRIVVSYPPGGGTDTLARLIADQLGRKWGQSAIVENNGG